MRAAGWSTQDETLTSPDENVALKAKGQFVYLTMVHIVRYGEASNNKFRWNSFIPFKNEFK